MILTFIVNIELSLHPYQLPIPLNKSRASQVAQWLNFPGKPHRQRSLAGSIE